MTKEIVRYAIVDDCRDIIGQFHTEKEAATSFHLTAGRTIVKLTGQMPEPKKPKIMAHAIRKQCGMYSLSTNMYDSEDSARKVLLGTFHSWPAVAKDGFYEVPE
jgi:hypothetical protein